MRRAIIGVFLGLSACGGRDDPARFEAMSGLNNWAAIIRQPIDVNAVEAAAKKKCRTESQCSVYGWTDEANMASTLPMLDRETAAMVFSYSVNRDTGFEQALWNCRIVSRSSPDQCFSEPEKGQSFEVSPESHERRL